MCEKRARTRAVTWYEEPLRNVTRSGEATFTVIWAKSFHGISPPSFHDTVSVFARCGTDHATHPVLMPSGPAIVASAKVAPFVPSGLPI